MSGCPDSALNVWRYRSRSLEPKSTKTWSGGPAGPFTLSCRPRRHRQGALRNEGRSDAFGSRPLGRGRGLKGDRTAAIRDRVSEQVALKTGPLWPAQRRRSSDGHRAISLAVSAPRAHGSDPLGRGVHQRFEHFHLDAVSRVARATHLCAGRAAFGAVRSGGWRAGIAADPAAAWRPLAGRRPRAYSDHTIREG